MKDETKKMLKKIFTSPIFLISSIIIIVFPIGIHISYKFPGNYYTTSVWNSEHMLEYGATIIGSLIVYFTVVLTLTRNQEENEKLIKNTIQENEKIIKMTVEENSRIINNSHIEKKYEDYSKTCSQLLSLINDFKEIEISKIGKEIDNNSDIKLKIQNLALIFNQLNILINQIQIHIPSYMREYFKIFFIDSDFFMFESYIKNILSHYNNRTLNFNNLHTNELDFIELCDDYNNRLKRFSKAIYSHCFAFSDCFFDEKMFIKEDNSESDYVPYGITNVISKYEEIYKY